MENNCNAIYQYECNNCTQVFMEPFEGLCPLCGSKNIVKGYEDECTCPPVDITWTGGEVCPACKQKAQQKYGDTIPIEGEF